MSRTPEVNIAGDVVGTSRRKAPAKRLLEFSREAQANAAHRHVAAARRATERLLERTPRERFLRAIEMEKSGFVDGAIVLLRGLCEEVPPGSDPCLAIGIRYFLASFLLLQDHRSEARVLTEEGIILAWEHEARDELELLDELSRQLGDECVL